MKSSINIFEQVAKACVDHLLSNTWKQQQMQQHATVYRLTCSQHLFVFISYLSFILYNVFT